MQYEFIYDSFDYEDALNYDGTPYYNPPIQIIIDGRKFVLPFGTADKKTVKIEGTDVYIVGENRNCEYISLVYIDMRTCYVQNVYLHGDDLYNPEAYSCGIMDMDTDKQIQILSEWLQ